MIFDFLKDNWKVILIILAICAVIFYLYMKKGGGSKNYDNITGEWKNKDGEKIILIQNPDSSVFSKSVTNIQSPHSVLKRVQDVLNDSLGQMVGKINSGSSITFFEFPEKTPTEWNKI